MAIEYDDFSIRLVPQEDGRLLVHGDGLAGSSTESLRIDGVDNLHILLDRLSGWWRARLRELYEPGEESPAPTHPPEAVGRQLFSLLFTGQVRDLFERSLGAAEAAGRGLRLVLRFDPRDPGMEHLSRLPWELLSKQEAGQSLPLDPNTPLVRYLDNVPQPTTLPPLRETLRVLVVVPDAWDLPALDAERECKVLKKSFADLPIAATYLTSATREDLVRSLTTDRRHILHFIGHGGLDSATGHGFLALTGPGKSSDRVSGAELATLVRSSTTLRFVFLNACQTGGQGAGEHAAFAGVASALVLHGVPAVLAMQARVADDDAIAFARAVYGSLARGATLEEAVGRGREALAQSTKSESVPAIPVLFSRTRAPVVSVLNPLGLSTLWTVLGLLTLSLTFNVWSRTQGWALFLPGIELADIGRYASATYGILLGIPLLAALLNVTRSYQRTRTDKTFVGRLPRAFGPFLLAPSLRSHQAAFFFLFLLFPMAGQIHFHDKMWGGTVYHRETGETSCLWERKPFGSTIRDEYTLEDPKTDRKRITFFPFWEPLALLLAEIALWLYFAWVSAGLFGWKTGRLRRWTAAEHPTRHRV